MEKGEIKLSGSSNKTSKKGGKRSKAQSAEEEARRREVVTEALRGKLDLESRALQIVERLLEDSVTEDFLVDCAKFITPSSYRDAVEERSIAKLCAYPICPNKLSKITTQQYKISTRSNKVYDITERKCYCSNFCYNASKEFELQISKTPLWLRHHESPPQVTLMKRGDGGRSGEEVRLLERRLREEDVERPLPDDPKAPFGPRERSFPSALGHDNSSDDERDGEQEQDFVSSVVSRQQGTRVHWGDLPKRTDKGEGREGGKKERRKKGKEENDEEEAQHQRKAPEGGRGQEDRREESLKSEMEFRTDPDGDQQLHTEDTEQPGGQRTLLEERPSSEGQAVDEAMAKLNLCTVTEPVPASGPVEKNPAGQGRMQEEHTALTPVTAPLHTDSNPTESRLQPDLNITRVGMSRRAAAGLRDLLQTHRPTAPPGPVPLSLLQGLRRTLKEWTTGETLSFLCGPDHSSGLSDRGGGGGGGGEKEREEEEELDEDDLEVEVQKEVQKEEGGRPSAPVPDYDSLRKEAQELQLRVREFYKGTWILPGQDQRAGHSENQYETSKDPALPLVDSQSQRVIRKRIVVEKLTRSLRDIVGPLRLTMTDVSSHLNNLVRTFRFTNTNIIYKTREWTVIAVVLLHVLSEVSPEVKEALESPPSVEYLQTLTQELSLQYQDLLTLVQLIKTPHH